MTKLRDAVRALLDDNAWCDIEHKTAQAILDALAADDDAAKLEAVVEAAREMRELWCCLASIGNHYHDATSCRRCAALRAFDAALARLEGKP